MTKLLRIGVWNASGLHMHKIELQTFLAVNKMDLILISEAHFTEGTVFTIPKYTEHRILLILMVRLMAGEQYS